MRRKLLLSSAVGGPPALAALALFLSGGLTAFGYFSTSGSGALTANVATLTAPANVSAVATGSSVTVTWNAVTAPGGGAVDGYTVTRSGTSSANVCGFPTPIATTTCTDSPVANGTYTYTVTAVWRSWLSSAASGAATVAPTKLAFTTLPRAITAGATTGTIMIEREDANGNPTTVGTTTVNLTTSSGAGAFRNLADSLTITSVSIPDGSSGASFKYTDTAAGTPTLTASDGAAVLASGTQQATVSSANGTALVYLTSPQTTTAGISSGTITVQRRDQYGNAATNGSVTIDLSSSSAQGLFYDTTDSSQLTQLILSNGTTNGSFLYRDATAGAPVVTAAADDASLTSATQTETVTPAAAAKFVFTSSALSGTASSTASLGPATVQRQDSFGNPITAGTTTVNLASNTTGTAVFSATLNGTGVSSVTITPGSSSVSFYYGDTKAASPVVTASGTLTSATQTETVTAASASKFAFTSTALSGAASSTASLGPATVQRQDTFGNPTTSGSTTVNLASNTIGTAVFSSTLNGTGVSSVTITGGSSSVDFYYGDTKAASPLLTASGALTSATQTEAVSPAAAAKFAFTSTALSGAASSTASLGPATVQRQDSFGNPATTGSTTVNLASNTTGTAVFSATLNGTGVSSVTITGGNSSVSFYYGDTKAASPVVTASGTLTSATQTETVSAASASKFAFTSTALSGAASSTASLGPATVQRQDTFGNPATTGSTTVNLASNTTGTPVFSASLNGTGVSSVTITAGNSSVSFYYGDTKAASPVVTASGTLTSATQTETVSAATASKFVFTSTALSGAASSTASLGPATVQRQDAFGNPSTSGSTTVNLSSNTTGTAVFAATLNGTGVSTVTITGGSSSVSFYYGDTKVASPVVTASGTLTSATQTETVTVAAASKLAFTQQPASSTGGVAFPTQPKVTVQDQFGNPVTNDSTTIVALAIGTNPSSGTLTCANATASSGVATFAGCKIDKAGAGYTLVASKSGGGLATDTSASLNITVGTATQFAVSASSTATAGTAITSITLTAQDAGANTATSYTGAHTITWSGAATSPGGTAPVYPTTSVSFTSGVSTTALSATLYSAGVNTLTATAAPVAGSATITVSAAAQQVLRYVTTSGGTTNACPSDQVGNGVSLTAFVAVLDTYGNLTVNGASPLTITITKVTGGGNAPSPASLTVLASANPAVTSGSTLLKLPSGNPADTTYTASSGTLTSVSCILRKS